jgi:hypothetical protein
MGETVSVGSRAILSLAPATANGSSSREMNLVFAVPLLPAWCSWFVHGNMRASCSQGLGTCLYYMQGCKNHLSVIVGSDHLPW